MVVAVGGALDQFRPPGGWIALEFPAWTESLSRNPPARWQADEREAALFGLGLDFLFLMIYPLFLSLLCGRAAVEWDLPAWLSRVSGLFAAVVLLAAPLDALENIGLHRMIMGDDSPHLQVFVTAVAAPKWFLSIATALIGLYCVFVHFWRNRDQD